MNFFEHQTRARRSTAWLVGLFAAGVACMVAAVTLVLAVAVGPDPASLALAALAVVAVIGFASLFRIMQLRGGGDVVASSLGGVPVPEDTRDPQLRRLRNVVEEMAIASGVPVPAIFVLDREPGINAFAAGYAPSDAAIAVTRGALEKLNRDELQGVVAHEFSHILNGDMRLNIRLMGTLFGISMLGLIGRHAMEGGVRVAGVRRRNEGPSVGLMLLLAGLAAWVIGSLGVVFARLVKAGVSRSREMLADATAVQYTRQTAGLAGALKKIAGVHEGSQFSRRSDAEEVSHMLFGDGMGLSGLFATHPPILERIRALEPGFSPEAVARLRDQWRITPPDGMREDVMLGLAPAGEPLRGQDARYSVSPAQVAAQVANPGDDDYRRADEVLSALPAPLRELARERANAMPLLLGLLLCADDARLRGRQIAEIRARLGDGPADAADRIQVDYLDGLHPAQRLPLAQLAFPLVRRFPRPHVEAFLDAMHALVHADGQVSLFEYCLGRLLETQVREALAPGRHARFGRRRQTDVRQEFAVLLSTVAAAGHPNDPEAARHAYLAGLQRVLPRDHLPYAPPAEGVVALDAVWDPLDRLVPAAKQVLVESLTAAVTHDGRITVAEAELLRTICGVLHCPLPPMLESG